MFSIALTGLPVTLALAVVAAIGYLVGRRTRGSDSGAPSPSQREMEQAKAVVREMEAVAQQVRRELATHHASILRFKERVSQLGGDGNPAAWDDLRGEAEKMLPSTVQLADQIARAYNEIREHTSLLTNLTSLQTDPLTGLRNRQALEESLAKMFALMARYSKPFSLLIVNIDAFSAIDKEGGQGQGDRVLQRVANLLNELARDTDTVNRYGGEEFVLILPETDLDGASVHAERIRQAAQQQLPVTLSCGVASALDGDSPQTLVTRADTALYSSKTGGGNCVYRHTGTRIEPVTGQAWLADSQPEDGDDAPSFRSTRDHGAASGANGYAGSTSPGLAS